MTAMVQLWRNVWEAPDMPFYYVQIAPHKYKDSRDTGTASIAGSTDGSTENNS